MWRSAFLLARGAMPAVLVATVVPLVLFWSALAAASVMWAIAVSVTYAYAVALFQYRRRGRVSGMLMVTVLMATVKAVTAVLSGHAVVYFAIPAVETAAFGLMFITTMFSGEPLVVRLARDLVPGAADGLATHRSLVRSLSIVWTLTYLGSGATTLALLITTPLPVFLGAHTVTGWLWTGSGAACTVVVCRLRARGLVASLTAAATPERTGDDRSAQRSAAGLQVGLAV
jgi:hypothetical protein